MSEDIVSQSDPWAYRGLPIHLLQMECKLENTKSSFEVWKDQRSESTRGTARIHELREGCQRSKVENKKCCQGQSQESEAEKLIGNQEPGTRISNQDQESGTRIRNQKQESRTRNQQYEPGTRIRNQEQELIRNQDQDIRRL
ncbi:Hypothetical predicted protein [Pelobates cultripes]|uniref:Uncharacterized protein n=1 Tax=Pelobates cultripes TaxID=61616 RepID=A0AAD1S214_PELCU|nr:Hypothetical predicted protein [Pelobates cultripes]